MKKIIFTVIVSTIIGTIGCRKTDQNLESKIPVPDKIPITHQSIKNQISFAEENLKVIGLELAKLAKNKEFVNFVHNEVKKKFDGEYEVLIQDLQKNSTWKNQLNIPAINNALNAFKNIAGNSFYPHVYIPKFLKDEEGNNTKKNTQTNSTSSIANRETSVNELDFIFYGGDQEVDPNPSSTPLTYPGYVLNTTNNQLESVGQIDENYANEHEVWVLGINESVNDLAQLILDDNGGGGSGGGSGGSGSGGGGTYTCTDVDCDLSQTSVNTPIFDNSAGHLTVNCKIGDMAVKDPKESWVAGAAEVSIRAKLSCHNDRERGMPTGATLHYRSNQYSNLLGRLIRKFKRKEIKNQDIVTVDYILQEDWPYTDPFVDPIYFDYVIFEMDRWPAERQINTIYGRVDSFTGGTQADDWRLDYRADKKSDYGWELPYSQNTLVNTQALFGPPPPYFYHGLYYNQALIDNSSIKFNTIGY